MPSGRGDQPIILFDLFGTLLDVASLTDLAAPVVPDGAGFVQRWRETQVSTMLLSAATAYYRDFDEITALALDRTAGAAGVTIAPEVRGRLLGGWRELRPYADAFGALHLAREAGLSPVVFTNATARTAQAALEYAGLSTAVDRVLSVEEAAMLKPNARAYEWCFATTRAPLAATIFVTAATWDAAGAGAVGIPVAWCRRGAPASFPFGPAPRWTIESLNELRGVLAAPAGVRGG